LKKKPDVPPGFTMERSALLDFDETTADTIITIALERRGG
jgi:hypothetical protein